MAAVTDEELIQEIQAGDMESLATLVVRWEDALYRFVFRLLPRSEDARDVCQETFLRILKKSDRFRAGSRFSTWMYQIALNLCRDHRRKKRRWGLILSEGQEIDDDRTPTPSAPGDAGSSGVTGADPLLDAERRERHEALALALREIPPEQREVLVLKEYEGLKFREIAEIVGCPESTVKSRMYYGLNGLRQALGRRGITEI